MEFREEQETFPNGVWERGKSMNRFLIWWWLPLIVVLLGSCASPGRCANTTSVEPIQPHRFINGLLGGSLVGGHVASLDTKGTSGAYIEIDEVLFGEPPLVGKRFHVQTSNDSGYGGGVVCPMLKPGEKAVWVVDASHGMPHFESDGLKHTDPKIKADYDAYGFGYRHWPLRESDKENYAKAHAMAAVLKRLESSKDWTDFMRLFRKSSRTRRIRF